MTLVWNLGGPFSLAAVALAVVSGHFNVSGCWTEATGVLVLMICAQEMWKNNPKIERRDGDFIQ